MMNILSNEVRAEMARKKLQNSRMLATGLLVLAFVLFILASLWIKQYPGLGYLRAFAEAAMVGALADWFAVTALFRHPLGLPIPHTAILPKNQLRIAEELGRFIEHNFIQGKPIAVRVYRAAPSEKLLAWMAANRETWLPWAVRQLPALLKVAKPDQVARFALPFLTAQTQQFAACDQRSLSSVKHPVTFKMRAKAMRSAIHKRLTQGLQIHMQIFAFNLKAHDCRLYLR